MEQYLCSDLTQALGGHEGYLEKKKKRSLGWEELED